VIAKLDSESAKIEELIARIDKQLTLMKDRRQALIMAAVAGQIDVSTARAV
jgi:hypothetical protein